MSKKIVGITGRAGSGKSTVAAQLEGLFPGSEAFALADPIKVFAAAVFGFSQTQLWGPSVARGEVLPQSPEFWAKATRIFRQQGYSALVGWAGMFQPIAGSVRGFADWFTLLRSECQADPKLLTARHVLQTLGTEFGRANLGPDVWVNRALRLIDRTDCSVAIITDVRFDNEARAIVDAGGVVINVRRLVAEAAPVTHESEQGINPDLVRATVLNAGTIEDLRNEVQSTFETLGWLP
jgi:energy-coupling factor transporter ATP-binding protein EcfA2